VNFAWSSAVGWVPRQRLTRRQLVSSLWLGPVLHNVRRGHLVSDRTADKRQRCAGLFESDSRAPPRKSSRRHARPEWSTACSTTLRSVEVECKYESRRLPDMFPETVVEIEGSRGAVRIDAGLAMHVTADGRRRSIDVDVPLLSWAKRPWH
jgi:hypothetical protein